MEDDGNDNEEKVMMRVKGMVMMMTKRMVMMMTKRMVMMITSYLETVVRRVTCLKITETQSDDNKARSEWVN